jgi:hypothetical protein
MLLVKILLEKFQIFDSRYYQRFLVCTILHFFLKPLKKVTGNEID